MKTVFFLSFIFCIYSLPAQTTYFASTGKGHCSVKLNKDNTYEQQVYDCLYNFMTEGTFTKQADTLVLKASKMFYMANGRKKLITDTTSATAVKFRELNTYIVKSDTLIQLDHFKGNYYPTWRLAVMQKP